MILKPSIDSLLNRVDSKYSLVILSSKRAHELEAGATPLLTRYDSVKNVGRALEEIDAGKIIPDPHPEEKRAMMKAQAEAEELEQIKKQVMLGKRIIQNQR